MITVSYNLSKKEWFHSTKESIYWGKHNSLMLSSDASSPISFQLKRKRNKVGPIIGILAGQKENGFRGNSWLFQKIHQEIQRFGGLAVIFTLSGIKENRIKGYIFIDQLHKWMYCEVPVPDVIYNRLPFRKNEKSSSFKLVNKWVVDHDLPFFNPCFFSKHELHNIFSQQPFLSQHIPDTCLLNKNYFSKMLQEHHSIFLKPAHGNKGNGIASVSLKSNENQYFIQTQNDELSFSSFNSCWDAVSKLCGKKEYIIQQQIPLQTQNGAIFDFRVLAHKVGTTWVISGIGIRSAAASGLTTHVPRGGSILKLKDVTPQVDRNLMLLIVNECGRALESTYGLVREFSLDVGRTNDLTYFIFEANAKPMKFDETIIHQKGLENLIKIFYIESKFDMNET